MLPCSKPVGHFMAQKIMAGRKRDEGSGGGEDEGGGEEGGREKEEGER